jgi:hypothetical protein
MKISLSPEEKLGRMLHNFSCTAYEIAECTSENLRAYNLLRYEDRDIYVPMWKTIDLSGTSPTEVLTLNIPQDGDITSLRFDDMRPGEYVRIMFKDRSIELF